MKKNYITAILAISLLISNYTFAQEMLYGGDMEEELEWNISFLNQDEDNTVEFKFGYTDDYPSEGIDGCLYVTGSNTGEDGGNLTNVMFYQEVTLEKGVEYMFDGAYKDIRSNNFWLEVYVGGNEPTEGNDYGADQGAVLVSGFKSVNWESNCPEDEFDGTFVEDACIAEITNMVYFEGEGDTTVFFGFRMGIWDGDGNGYEFEVFVDNISLASPVGAETSVRTMNKADMNVYPTHFNNELHINAVNGIDKVELINMTGQTVASKENINNTSYQFQLGNLQKGFYTIVVSDLKGLKGTSKVLKQ